MLNSEVNLLQSDIQISSPLSGAPSQLAPSARQEFTKWTLKPIPIFESGRELEWPLDQLKGQDHARTAAYLSAGQCGSPDQVAGYDSVSVGVRL